MLGKSKTLTFVWQKILKIITKINRVLQEQSAILKESVLYVNIHPYNQTHQRIYPTLNCNRYKEQKKKPADFLCCYLLYLFNMMHYSYTMYVRILTTVVNPSDTEESLLRSTWRSRVAFSGTSASLSHLMNVRI
jgi:hypothetical protein